MSCFFLIKVCHPKETSPKSASTNSIVLAPHLGRQETCELLFTIIGQSEVRVILVNEDDDQSK
jgi:hypothetical protein